jgi:hypothetical protein
LQIFVPNEKIENINDQYWTLRAEEVYIPLLFAFMFLGCQNSLSLLHGWSISLLQIPEEEKNISPHDRLIHVYHFAKDTQNQTVIRNEIYSVLKKKNLCYSYVYSQLLAFNYFSKYKTLESHSSLLFMRVKLYLRSKHASKRSSRFLMRIFLR